ncbi:hypothetical protein Pla175_06630 [Pirellulimonas nuda]|uniref:DUF1559 domain-containing protein n=1 Tax=Pirellulimonas nuda TaxID=2528009 RepID=A0A518D741_9BACT|nr:DUF1559 domain-containing protein [Pirellulimonas nuda]QDU87304.1 hypothetical protein Pla175_06630 [Pirellulimonas nuda]
MRFRLTTLLYVFALIAVGIRIFGAAGLLVAALVPGFWWWVREWLRRPLFAATSVALLVATAILGALVFPFDTVRTPSYRNMEASVIKQCALALASYQRDHGALPPPCTKDKNGKPLHSWRTLLLPYLEEPELYKRIRLDEPWDSPANLAVFESTHVLGLTSPTFQLYGLPDDGAYYLAVTGDGTLWGPPPLANMQSCAADRVLVVQTAIKQAKWYEPVDLTIDEFTSLMTGDDQYEMNTVHQGYFATSYCQIRRRQGRAVAMRDCLVRFANRTKDAAAARSLVLVTDDPIEVHEIANLDWPSKGTVTRLVGVQVHWGRVWNVAVFVALALLPARWVFRRRADA